MQKNEIYNHTNFDLSAYSSEEIHNSGFEIVAQVWLNDNLYSLNNENLSEFERRKGEEEKNKFVKRFFKGYRNRPSSKKGNPSSTIPDPLVSRLVSIRIDNEFEEKDITKMHRASMSSENLIGALLEEYIAIHVIDKGWAICWGTTIKATDFVSKYGHRLQIKNKTNTENSSSNKIRLGTSIEVWHRFDARTGRTYWHELNKIIGQDCNLSEEEFEKFAIMAIKNNPEMLNLDGL